MVWYDELYRSFSIADIVDALDRLGGEGSSAQIHNEIKKMYALPKGSMNNRDLIKGPLEVLTSAGFVELKGSKFLLKRYI